MHTWHLLQLKGAPNTAMTEYAHKEALQLGGEVTSVSRLAGTHAVFPSEGPGEM